MKNVDTQNSDTEKKKEKIKYPGFLNKIWYDPIWSKVLYTGVLFIIGLLYSFFKTLLKDISFYDAFIQTINFEIKLSTIFIIISIALIFYGVIYKIRQNRQKHIGKFDVEQKIGHFNFRELYNALLTHTIDLPISLRRGSPDGKLDLLTLFILYQRQLNKGIDWDTGGDQGTFLYYDLCPNLMSYGLMKLTKNKNKADSLGLDLIITSETGYEFFAQIQRYRVYNDYDLNDNVTATKYIEKE